jgi:hypothetical protein
MTLEWRNYDASWWVPLRVQHLPCNLCVTCLLASAFKGWRLPVVLSQWSCLAFLTDPGENAN